MKQHYEAFKSILRTLDVYSSQYFWNDEYYYIMNEGADEEDCSFPDLPDYYDNDTSNPFLALQITALLKAEEDGYIPVFSNGFSDDCSLDVWNSSDVRKKTQLQCACADKIMKEEGWVLDPKYNLSLCPYDQFSSSFSDLDEKLVEAIYNRDEKYYSAPIEKATGASLYRIMKESLDEMDFAKELERIFRHDGWNIICLRNPRVEKALALCSSDLYKGAVPEFMVTELKRLLSEASSASDFTPCDDDILTATDGTALYVSYVPPVIDEDGFAQIEYPLTYLIGLDTIINIMPKVMRIVFEMESLFEAIDLEREVENFVANKKSDNKETA